MGLSIFKSLWQRRMLQFLLTLCTDHNETLSMASDKSVPRRILKQQLELYYRCRSQNRFMIFGLIIGLSNVWEFPYVVAQNGGSIFIVLYIIFALLFGFPLLSTEMAIGQYTRSSAVYAFRCAPIFCGLGFSSMITTFLIAVIYGVFMTWILYYLFATVLTKMAWNHCNNYFNTYNCQSSFQIMNSNKVNLSLQPNELIHVSSAEEYWLYYVVSVKKYPSDILYQLNEAPGLPNWKLIICMLGSWMITTMAVLFRMRSRSNMLTFFVVGPFFGLLLLLIKLVYTPGSWNGLSRYLAPDWSALIHPATYITLVKQIFFSLAIGSGCILTITSTNRQHDNFIRDAFIVIAADTFFNILGSLVVFSLLGIVIARNGGNINILKQLATSSPGLYFITFTSAIANDGYSRIWTFIVMTIAFLTGINTQVGLLYCVVVNLGDTFPRLFSTNRSRNILTFVTVVVLSLIGIFFLTPGGFIWFSIVTNSLTLSISLPIMATCQSVIFSFVLGLSSYRERLHRMLTFDLPFVFVILFVFVAPSITAVIIVFSFIYRLKLEHSRNYFKVVYIDWILFLFTLAPIFIFAIYSVIHYRRLYPKLPMNQFINLLRTNKSHGSLEAHLIEGQMKAALMQNSIKLKNQSDETLDNINPDVSFKKYSTVNEVTTKYLK